MTNIENSMIEGTADSRPILLADSHETLLEINQTRSISSAMSNEFVVGDALSPTWTDSGQICGEERYVSTDEYYSEDSGDSSDNTDLTYKEANFVSSSDQGTQSNESDGITSALAQWAVTYAIPHNAINALLTIVSKHHVVPADARTLLKTYQKYQIVPMNDLNGSPGEYVYLGIERGLRECVSDSIRAICAKSGVVELVFNVDGLPLYRSSVKQFWPVLCMVNLSKSPLPVSIFAVAVFSGNSKPESADMLLKDVVAELSNLLQNGIEVNERMLNVKVKAFVCDTPARAFIKCIKGHTGLYGCEKCVQKGESIDHRVVFLEMNANRRTDVGFLSQEQPQHHRGVSPLCSLQFPLVSKVPLDYMHLVCLGVVRKLLHLWVHGDLRVRISMQQCGVISFQLLQLKAFMCSEFVRKPRALAELERWKAVEFRTFLLYTGPLVLRDVLSPRLYHHFLLLHFAIKILASDYLCHSLCDLAEHLLELFVDEMREIYGETSIVYNVHNLIHLAEDVRTMGSLDSFSAFPFENALGKMKNLLRTGNKPLAQLCRRLSEQQLLQKSVHCSVSAYTLRRAHRDGPLLETSGLQFCHLQIGSLTLATLSASQGNCYAVTTANNFVQILNIVEVNVALGKSVILVCKFFNSRVRFYEYPKPSEMLKIYRISRLSERMIEVCITDILYKCVVLPRKDYFVAFPLH
jgi:hypothetical protein